MLIYRKNKNSPLTSQEVDGNFEDLDTRLKLLEDKKCGERICNVSLTIEKGENALTFFGTMGSKFGPLSLPLCLSWNPRGIWQANRPYEKGDIVQWGHALYLCEIPHKNGSFSYEEDTQWRQIFTLEKMLDQSLVEKSQEDTQYIPPAQQEFIQVKEDEKTEEINVTK